MLASAPKRGLTLAQANLLLLFSLVLILVAGILSPNQHFYWTLLIREALLVLGPALLFLALLGLPWQETLRWHMPSWRVLGASVLIGLGGWLFDTWLGTFFGELLGYTLPLPPDFYPTTAAQALALFCLLAVIAPICEEVLFRGLIQRGYEQLGEWASILLTGLLFALFHQSLAQGMALIPLAILLSYLAWRTDSLPAAILAHAVNNAPAALLLPLSTKLPELGTAADSAAASELTADLVARITAINPAICALPAALLGGLLVLGGLWGIHRWCPKRPPLQHAPLRPGLGRWLGRTWPLLLIVPLALFTMGAELVMGRFPELLSMGRAVRFAAAPWGDPQTLRYEVRNLQGETMGTIECTLTPKETVHNLACRRRSAYQTEADQRTLLGNLDERLTAQWRRSDLRLQSVERQRQPAFGWQSFSAAPLSDSVRASWTTPEGRSRTLQLPLPDPALSTPLGDLPLSGRSPSMTTLQPLTVIERGEWPWRFSALPFQGIYSAQAALLDPDPPAGDEPTLTRASIVVYGSEPVATPAGTFIAWRVEVGPDHVAWYDAEEPHTLVALEDGNERWVLTSIE